MIRSSRAILLEMHIMMFPAASFYLCNGAHFYNTAYDGLSCDC